MASLPVLRFSDANSYTVVSDTERAGSHGIMDYCN
jgi:hypothetical protein